MEKVELLNIPNYFSSFYLKGLYDNTHVEYRQNQEFNKWNGFPLIILKTRGKLVVIDNRDPVGVPQDLYSQAHVYFATNQLKNSTPYNQNGIKPLYPHYPIDTWDIYLKIFGFEWIRTIGWKNTLREIYTQHRKEKYKDLQGSNYFGPNVFYSGSIWKKEKITNNQRKAFIQACIENPEIKFEGGLVPRKEIENLGLNGVLGTKRYTSKEFIRNSSHSLINFNNPAVCGAISWRLAEYFNMGTFILSLPFNVNLPIFPKHGKEIHMVSDAKETPEVLKFVLNNKEYHEKIGRGAKNYFIEYCRPNRQIKMILNEV